ncbi:ABC transporter substrate-binding protein [Oricola nitratireducens]|jgi:branched-chain amino acid transport system substrate-binding protein|uniref:ABC transporter substrate-binding protein n=1 Tax=Oricola nitratireducens TaxID=2775868 RepID=UPI001865BA1D|nr:ABC transporter substrate-binding protein [Oricola nitratireducens]
MSDSQPKAPSRRKFLKTMGISAGSTAMLAGLNQSASAQSSEPVKIGCPAPLTGIVAADGIEFRRGLEMAAEEINAVGGILGRPVELVFVDTESKGDDVVIQAAQRLIDRDKASALVLGYNLETGTALHDVAADSGIVAMHSNTVVAHDELVRSDPEKYWGIFQYDPPETFYGIGFLDFVKGLEDRGEFTRPNNKIAIITGPGTYSTNIANAIKDNADKYGLEVSLFESVNVPISEWGPTLAKVRADEPAIIAVTHFYAADQAQFMNQFMSQPTNSLVYMQYGASLAAFRDIAGVNSEGVIYATVIGALQDEIGSGFAEKYVGKFGDTSSPNGGGQTYQALHAYAVAAALAGGPGEPYEEDRNRMVADRLRNLIYRGPMGTMRINPDGQSAFCYPSQTNDPSLGMPHIFSQIQDKAVGGVLIAPSPYDVGAFKLPSWMKA